MDFKVSVKITSDDMFQFMLYHTYKGISGKISIVLGVFAIIFAIASWGQVTTNYSLILIFIGLLFLVYQPYTLYRKSVNQVKKNPVFKDTLTYEFSDEGISVSQNDQKVNFIWQDIYYVKNRKKYILVYTSRIHAYILPKMQLDKRADDIVKLARSHKR